MTEKCYIVYDGRAEFQDTDDCSVMECNSTGFTRKDYDTWRGYDAVLFEYDVEQPGNNLINEKMIGHWREGFKKLKARCAP